MKTALALAALVSMTPARAQTCTPLDDLLKTAPKFADYAVKPVKPATPAPVDLRGNRQAREFRTALRDAAKDGPDFAGRYRIAGWGCGTSCLDWGMIDEKTGKVTFDARIRTLENPSSDWDRNAAATRAYAAQGANGGDFDLLLFRPDSALLITLGAPGEDESRSGIAWYRWTGRRFARLHFVKAESICRLG